MKLEVQGMTCGHCVTAVTLAIREIDANASVHVDLASGGVDISGDVSAEQAIQSLGESGYAARLAEPTSQAEVAPRAKSCCGSCHG